MSGKLKSDRTAILVIHGIGEQNPFETIDQFALGVIKYLREQCSGLVKPAFSKVPREGWTEVAVSIDVPQDDASQPAQKVVIYEYYWAPMTQGRISFIQTLKWLLRTDLSPLRSLASNLQEMAKVRNIESTKRFAWLFFREIRRILLIYLPLAVGVVWLMVRSVSIPSLGEFLAPLVDIFRGDPWWALPAALASYGLALFLLVFALRMIFRAFRRTTKTIERKAEITWFLSATVLASGFLWLGGSLLEWTDTTLAPIWKGLVENETYLLFIVVLVFPAVRYVTIEFLGDVAVYVNADAKAESYDARREILKGSMKALARLLSDAKYDRVLLAGHSLGSVIAYDTVNKILAQAPPPPGPVPAGAGLAPADRKKLRGLITFGSPLDKIFYFFRQHVKENQPIRAQILSMLHGFRKRSSHRDYGDYRIEYKSEQLENLVWMNAWSWTDPVSGKLQFYHVDEQKGFWYWIPGVAHMGYWDDPKFYAWFCGKLLVR